MKFKPAVTPNQNKPSKIYLFLIDQYCIILDEKMTIPAITNTTLLPAESIYLGTYEEIPCYVASATQSSIHERWQTHEIRALFDEISDDLYNLIGYASQILTWQQNHQYCSKCGSKTVASKKERSMTCNHCGQMNYPRISPSIIVAVKKGNELLMARSPHFKENLFSLIAGFLEPGETLEQCVEREVFEETGLKICNIEYQYSQPWPFPHSIMVGFTADYQSGEICIDPNEIEAAGWYTKDNLPVIPSRSTIARWLIDDYIKSSE